MARSVTVDLRRLNRATLVRQSLERRAPVGVVEAVGRAVALQAQEPAAPYVALWNRVAGLTADDVDRAFTDRTILKASLMRITLHAVTADDYPVFHAAMLPRLRAARLNDRRFLDAGLTAQDADALVPHLLAFCDRPRTKQEVIDLVAARSGSRVDDRMWWALRTFAPLVHAPTGTPWSFDRQPCFEAPPSAVGGAGHVEAVRRLVVRYLEGFGPAAVADIAQFTLHQRSTVRAVLDDLVAASRVVPGRHGDEMFDVPDAVVPEPDHPAPPRLMAMWDSTLLAYADRSRMIPDEWRAHVIRRNGDVLPTVLVDGFVAGVWRVVAEGIEVTAFGDVDDAAWDGLTAEAASLMTFVGDRDPEIFGRYRRWWSELPGSRHVLGG
jgi:hypothetical protein